MSFTTKLLILTFLCTPIAGSASTDVSEKHFAEARALYEARNFDAYFGLAQWMRFLHWQQLTQQQQDQWLELELLALARHCQWSAIKALEPAASQLEPLAARTLAMIRVKTDYAKFQSDPVPEKQALQTAWLTKQMRWKIDSARLAKLKDPRNVRVHVESLCK